MTKPLINSVSCTLRSLHGNRGAWHQWCAENQRQLIAPEERDEAFTLYLVRLIRNRMEEMNAWR
ncbi:hypothetical protein [Enterobacter asburiae]|uniref:hypothetical protein n=1 Tax=Enterobacter asburiae TaxID=61645 RepID=UPI001F5524D3|nr:hypothetical protein [Enterobacter asburiae]